MEYDAVRIGNITAKKEDVLLFEINAIGWKNYSLAELGRLYNEPNIRLKFKNNGKLYCGDADMLFILAHDDKQSYMREIYLPYKDGKNEKNRCETTINNGDETYIEVNKFDIYSYINSNAVAEHCKKIGHKFSPAECAYIVNASENYTIKEKHAMYKHIIETMTDEKIKIHNKGSFYPKVSLKEYLEKYMDIENKLLKDFYTEDDEHIYTGDVYKCGDASVAPIECGPCKSLNGLCTELNEFFRGKTGKTLIKKEDLNTQKYSVCAIDTCKTDHCKEPVFIKSDDNLTDEEYDVLMIFDLMWFVCPTPFEKGDILSYHPIFASEYTEDFVLEKICYVGEDERYFRTRKKIGGSMDMTAYGYFAGDDGRIYCDCMHDYMSLEYCDKEQKNTKVFKVLSNCLKGKTGVQDTLNEYMSEVMKNRIEQLNKFKIAEKSE